jgi:hypothetical protein
MPRLFGEDHPAGQYLEANAALVLHFKFPDNGAKAITPPAIGIITINDPWSHILLQAKVVSPDCLF